jgi:hypothetical protein
LRRILRLPHIGTTNIKLTFFLGVRLKHKKEKSLTPETENRTNLCCVVHKAAFLQDKPSALPVFDDVAWEQDVVHTKKNEIHEKKLTDKTKPCFVSHPSFGCAGFFAP